MCQLHESAPSQPWRAFPYNIFFAHVLQDKLHAFRVQITKALFGKPGKAAKAPTPAAKPTHVTIYVASAYAPWQAAVLRILAGLYDAGKYGKDTGFFPPDALGAVKTAVMADPALKPLTKKVRVTVDMCMG